MKLKAFTWEGIEKENVVLSDAVFGLPLRKDILHRVIQWQLSKRRSGTHKTKGVSEVSGTTKKPYKQKGTGNARQGSLRSAQFRKGGVIFGPVVRSHEFDLPKKVRKLGLKVALSVKAMESKLFVIDDVSFSNHKTSHLKNVLSSFGCKGSVLLVDADAANDSLRRASSNLVGVDFLPQIGLNVYDLVRHEYLLLTKQALEVLEGRLNG
jgi:large subunit ribosomal protein L4